MSRVFFLQILQLPMLVLKASKLSTRNACRATGNSEVQLQRRPPPPPQIKQIPLQGERGEKRNSRGEFFSENGPFFTERGEEVRVSILREWTLRRSRTCCHVTILRPRRMGGKGCDYPYCKNLSTLLIQLADTQACYVCIAAKMF
jgi:hypothetical protein